MKASARSPVVAKTARPRPSSALPPATRARTSLEPVSITTDKGRCDVEAHAGRDVEESLVLPGHEVIALKHRPPARGVKALERSGDWGYVLRQAAQDGCVACVERVVRALGRKWLLTRGIGTYIAIDFAKYYAAREPAADGDYPRLLEYLKEQHEALTDADFRWAEDFRRDDAGACGGR